MYPASAVRHIFIIGPGKITKSITALFFFCPGMQIQANYSQSPVDIFIPFALDALTDVNSVLVLHPTYQSTIVVSRFVYQTVSKVASIKTLCSKSMYSFERRFSKFIACIWVLRIVY